MGHIESAQDLQERIAWIQSNGQRLAHLLEHGKEAIAFVFSGNEPTDRLTTRIGGLPCWPRGQPWPVCHECSLIRPQPMSFVAQLDFRDTLLRTTVPGDVLVFHYCFSCHPAEAGNTGERSTETEAFRKKHGLPLPDLTSNLVYVPVGSLLTWQAGISGDGHIGPEDIPVVEGAPQVGPFFGSPQPVTDYPEPPAAYYETADESNSYLHFTLHGTKLGGYPPAIQSFDIPTDSHGQQMRFLGTIGSVTSHALAQASHIAVEGRGDLMWGDMGCVYLWITEGSGPEMTWFWLGF